MFDLFDFAGSQHYLLSVSLSLCLSPSLHLHVESTHAMDGWMEGGREGWKDGWMDGWMDGWVDRTYVRT